MGKMERKSFIFGIIGSIIATMIYNNFPFLLNNISEIGGNLVDLQYTMSAKVNDNTLLSYLYCLTCGFLLGYSVPEIFNKIIRCFRGKLKKKGRYNEINTSDELTYEELRNEVNKLGKEIEETKGILKLYQAISFLILVVIMTFFVIVPVNLKATFDREIIKIKPYVTAEEIDKLNSDWVRIRNKEDYIIIKGEIKNIEIKNNIYEEGR